MFELKYLNNCNNNLIITFKLIVNHRLFLAIELKAKQLPNMRIDILMFFYMSYVF